MTEIIIGLDPHKSSNTIAVIDRDETLKTRRRFDNTDDGLVEHESLVGDPTYFYKNYLLISDSQVADRLRGQHLEPLVRSDGEKPSGST